MEQSAELTEVYSNSTIRYEDRSEITAKREQNHAGREEISVLLQDSRVVREEDLIRIPIDSANTKTFHQFAFRGSDKLIDEPGKPTTLDRVMPLEDDIQGMHERKWQ